MGICCSNVGGDAKSPPPPLRWPPSRDVSHLSFWSIVVHMIYAACARVTVPGYQAQVAKELQHVLVTVLVA